MTFRERGRLSLILLAAFCVLMLVAGLFSLIINGPPRVKAKHKSDQEIIEEEAERLEIVNDCIQHPNALRCQ